MKDNKTLKILSYILISISIPILLISIFFFCFRNSIKDNTESYEDNIVSALMTDLSEYARRLMSDRPSYNHQKDADTIIYYRENTKYYGNIENLYVYMKYKNKVITNVELTSETNTVQGIKDFINSQSSKKLSIINGNVQTDTDLINKKAVQYFDGFDINIFTDKEIVEESNANKGDLTTRIEDFEIYGSYNERLNSSEIEKEVIELMNTISKCSNVMYIAIPLSVITIIVCTIYLCYSIDKSKFIWLDKLYYEILLMIIITLIGIVCVPLAIIFEINALQTDLNFIISIISTIYFVIYMILAFGFNTTVKRIKAKKFWKTTIAGATISWCTLKIKQTYSNLMNNLSRNKKLVLHIIGFIIVEILLVLIFNYIGVIADILLAIYAFNKVMKYIASYEKIEDKLKGMYDGNNKIVLEEDDVENEFRNSVKYINDISNGFENAIEESLKSEKLKTELITNVSHDIKTPLTSIINYVDLLKQEEINNDKAKEYIEILDTKSQRLKKLTEDLVEASKASSGTIKLNMEKINISELLKQSIGEFEDKFNKIGLQIITNYSKEDTFINADSRYLYRVIENLFSNISKYALKDSRVYIDVNSEDGKTEIVIKNISKEKLNISSDELIQRFVRGDKSRTTEGSGLGISIAKSLTELQKGKFDLKIDGDLFKVKLEFLQEK